MPVELLQHEISLGLPKILSSYPPQVAKVSISPAHLLPVDVVRTKSNPLTPVFNNVHLAPGVPCVSLICQHDAHDEGNDQISCVKGQYFGVDID